MQRKLTLSIYFLATFLQAGTYGLTFMLPRLFDTFGGNEKDVGMMLIVTTVSTLFAVYYSGHMTDKFGRLISLGLAGYLIAISFVLFGTANSVGLQVALASALLGVGWGVTYALTPVVLTRIVTEDERVRTFALLSLFVMAGFGLSPVMASMMEKVGFAVFEVFYTMGAICILSGTLLVLLRNPFRRLSLSDAIEASSNISLAHVKQIFRSRGFLPLFMAMLGASVFAGMSNFQTVFADAKGLDYADYFLTYTITVIICRIFLVRYKGGKAPYAMISALQYIMCASVVLFIFIGGSHALYLLVAILFGIGYGASYPILAAMAANDADKNLVPQTLQLFALTYFIGIFGFPLIAGWMIVEVGLTPLLIVVAVIAGLEATLAGRRYLQNQKEPVK